MTSFHMGITHFVVVTWKTMSWLNSIKLPKKSLIIYLMQAHQRVFSWRWIRSRRRIRTGMTTLGARHIPCITLEHISQQKGKRKCFPTLLFNNCIENLSFLQVKSALNVLSLLQVGAQNLSICWVTQLCIEASTNGGCIQVVKSIVGLLHEELLAEC